MSWLPSPTRVIVLVQQLEKGENQLQHATELFWLFCMHSLSPDEFKDRVLFWIDKHLEDAPKGGGFIDTEVKDIILQGPERVAEVIANRLDTLCEKKRVAYVPDEVGDPESLCVSIMLESSRLNRLLRIERYSERTREVLANALSAFARFIGPEESYKNPNWQPEYLTVVQAVGTFLYVTEFLIQKSDGQYEKSIESLAHGIGCYIMAGFQKFDRTKTRISEPLLLEFMSHINDHRQELPWIQTLEPQIPVDCFEALRKGERILDPKNIASICGFLAITYCNWWKPDDDDIEVKDAEGNGWKVTDYWHHASGLLEARLQPSDLRELLNEREDDASARRLFNYFFGEVLWAKLPQRAKSSLINADRDWFGGSLARIEAIPNELKIAAEEILLHGLWRPLENWVERGGIEPKDCQEFLILKRELHDRKWQPTLSHFERVCKMPTTRAFLKARGVAGNNLIWFVEDLPNNLSRLRLVRDRAEHVSVDGWTRQGIRQFVAEFIGIGQPGVLPQLAETLFSETPHL